MLGITLPDAIAIGTFLTVLLAAWRGSNQGAAARSQAVHQAPMVNIASGIVEANQFADYMKVQDKLAIAIDRHARALEKQHQVRFTNALEHLTEKVDEALNRHRRR